MFQDGDTLVVSQSTNALGATIAIQTLSTVPVATGLLTTTRGVLATTAAVVTPAVVTPTSRTTTRLTTSTTIPLVETDTEAAVPAVTTVSSRTRTTAIAA
jgi:hypothetical protein